MFKDIFQDLIALTYDVGEVILKYYDSVDTITIKNKANNTPVTEADHAAHHTIFQRLKQLTPDVPVLSEEGKSIGFDTRQQWHEYWLIDPLDGTKEFINNTDDFSVNIAYIKGHRPIFSIVYAPATDVLYYAIDNKAYRIIQRNVPEEIHTTKVSKPLKIAVSRHHQGDKLKAFLSQLDDYELVIMGSALKLCVVAEAKADIYLRLGPTSEWDTAAGQHVLECAGGTVIDLQGDILQYNTKDSLLNPSFLALGDISCNWQQYLVSIKELSNPSLS